MKMKFYFCLLLLSNLLLTVVAGCIHSTSTPAPKVRDFELNELLVDMSAFPPGWYQDGPAQASPYELTPRETQESIYIQFSPSDLGARVTHIMYRFRDSRTAKRGYRHLSRLYDADRVTPWSVPNWMQYQSPTADQLRFACADFFGGYPKVRSKDCVAVGQYAEYVSEFSISISPPESITDHTTFLGQVLQAIDERMTHYLKNKTY